MKNKQHVGKKIINLLLPLTVCIVPIIIILILYLTYFIPEKYKPYILKMAGVWKIKEGLNPDLIKPNMDDSNWKEVKLPGSFYDQGFHDRNITIKKNFILNTNFENQDLFFLIITNRDYTGNVYINGHKIGEIGSFNKRQSINDEINGFYINKDYVVKSNKNTILIEFGIIAIRDYGIHDPRILLGTYDRLKLYFEQNRTIRMFFLYGIIFSGIFVLIILFLLLFTEWKSANRNKYISYILLTLTIIFSNLSYSDILFYYFYLNNFIRTRLDFSLSVLTYMTTMNFIQYFFKNRTNIIAKINMVICLIAILIFFVIPRIDLIIIMNYLTIYFFAVSIYILIFCIIQIVKSREKQKAIVISVLLIIVGSTSILDLLNHLKVIYMPVLFPITISIYVIICIILILADFIKISYTNKILSLELKELNMNLEQKVVERTKQLEKAKNKIEEKEKQKTTFFINLTHETKTPLTIITNYLDKHINKHGSTEEIKIVEQNVNKLKNDVINFLDTEKLERGQVLYDHNQIINLSDVVSIKAMMFKEIAVKKNIKISINVDKNIHIKIDPQAIDRIINNLIDNAIKYTNENCRINVVLNYNKNKVKLFVSDTGIGISEENKKHIFEPYYQITHEKRNIQGMGMGLHIVKKIVDEIDAKFEINSELNKGTTFKIIFKNYKLKEGDEVNKNINYSKPISNVLNIKLKKKPYSDKNHNIFIIEDNLELLNYLQSELCEFFNTFIAKNGKEALEKIGSIPIPDLIISDIMMDQMDGYEFCKNIKEMEKYKNIPIIFLSAKTSAEDKKWGYIKGADDYITKPFNITELFLKMEKMLERKGKIIKEIIKEKEERIKNNYIRCKITKQEQKIIKLVKQGKENKEIANKLGIAENTVKNHLKNIFIKVDVKTRIELINIFS